MGDHLGPGVEKSTLIYHSMANIVNSLIFIGYEAVFS